MTAVRALARYSAIAIGLAACSGLAVVRPVTNAPDARDSTAPDDAFDAALGAGPVTVATDFDVEGHRGARGLRPENTLPAFETALDLGVDTLELDLHLSADDVLVVWHEPGIDRSRCRLDPAATAPLPPDPETATPEQLAIRALTMAQLRKYRCDRNPGVASFPEQTATATDLALDRYNIGSLADVFDFTASYATSALKTAAQRANARRVRFNVETKRNPDVPATIGDGFDGVHPAVFETSLAALVAGRGLVSRVIVQSFDHRSLWAIRTLEPGLTLSALTLGTVPFAALAAAGASIWSPNIGFVTRASVDAAHAAGLRVIPWTVNLPDTVRQLVGHGVDGVISDRPDMVLASTVRR
ncbi:MAG: glycerophosphodiester phosphodiesterase family protein [Deltaproteobacteria bacterium]